MKRFLLALIVAAAPLAVTSMPQTADACAMRKRKPAKLMLANKELKKARTAQEKGQTRKAIRHFAAAFNGAKRKDTTTRAEAGLALAQLNASIGRTTKAQRWAKKSEKFIKRDASALLTLGEVHLSLKDGGAALLHLNKALAQGVSYSDVSRVNLGLAKAHLQLSQTDEATKYLKAAEFAGAAPADLKAVKALLPTTVVAVAEKG